MGKGKRKKVYCEGCANLLLIKGLPPQCVATTVFIGGPLRSKVDIRGRALAEKRNAHNSCKYRESVSLRAYRLKRWIIKRLNDETEGTATIKEINLRHYSIKEENDRAKAYRAQSTDDSGTEGETEEEIPVEGHSEGVLSDGRVDGSN